MIEAMADSNPPLSTAPEVIGAGPPAPPQGLSPVARALFDYWDGKRRGRAVPARRDLDPLEMRAWLGHLILTEVVDGGRDFHIRLFGSEIARGLGYDMTGQNITDIKSSPQAIREFLADYRAVMATRQPSRAVYDYVSVHTGRIVKFERLLLPLSDDGTTVNMLLALRRDMVGDETA